MFGIIVLIGALVLIVGLIIARLIIEKSKRFPNEIIIYDRFLFIWKEQYKYWYVISAHHKEYLTKIEFVHEYQNFIFTLTGQELISEK